MTSESYRIRKVPTPECGIGGDRRRAPPGAEVMTKGQNFMNTISQFDKPGAALILI